MRGSLGSWLEHSGRVSDGPESVRVVGGRGEMSRSTRCLKFQGKVSTDVCFVLRPSTFTLRLRLTTPYLCKKPAQPTRLAFCAHFVQLAVFRLKVHSTSSSIPRLALPSLPPILPSHRLPTQVKTIPVSPHRSPPSFTPKCLRRNFQRSSRRFGSPWHR